MQKRVAGLFSGVGGIELGFQQAGFSVSWSNEIDKHACQTFRANFDHPLIEGDINELLEREHPSYELILNDPFDVLVGGFPCQAFSIAGERKGFNDERGNLFFSITKLLRLKKERGTLPPVLFLENVKNLMNHDNGNTFQVISSELKDLGYHVKYHVFNASSYAPTLQIRERIYIVGFLSEEDLNRFQWPSPLPFKQKESIKDFLEEKVDDKYYYTQERYPLYFREGLNLAEEIQDKHSFYQIRRGQYVRKLANGNCPTFTANMGTGGHNVPLIRDDRGIRKLSPRECFNLQGYPRDFKLPEMGNSHLYKQAGNSVVVPMVKRIAEEIGKVLEINSDKESLISHSL